MRTVRSLPICFLCAVVLGCLHGLLFNISSSSSAVAQTVCPSTDLIVCDDSSSGACVQGNYSACTVLCNDTDPVSVNLLVPCQSATFRDDSTVTCGKGSCIGITGLDSAISCVEEEFDSASTTCSVGSFYRSTVSCSGYACSEAAVYHSAVTCPGSYSCSADFKYKACTCFVDGDDTFPDCRNAVDFCGSLFLGRTCHEWGNPVCQDFSIASTGVNVTVCTEGDCQLQNFSNSAVWCDNYKAEKTCSQTEFHGIEVDCDDGACEGSRFVESTSTTCRGTSCQLAHFDRSIILCLATSDCDESTSFASQLTMGGYATISDYGCNCCDGSYCPETASSCITNPTGFCRSTYLGAMCKEWGNPVCENIPIETSGKTFTACTQGSCSGSVFSGAAVLCDNTKNLNLANTCNAVQVTSDSSLICQAGACSAATVSDSWVVCNDALGGGSCQTSSFSRSRVDCFAGSCSSSNYVASQVLCETSSCIDSTFDTCSCCEGYSCPEVSSCTTLDLAVFCLSCASNPICGRSFNETLVSPTVPTIIVPTASVPTTTSSTNAPAAATLPTVVPVSIPSPTGQTPTSPTGGATPPIAGPSLGVQVLKTSSGQSVDVVPPLGGGTVAAVDQPLFGSLTTKPDGTITYVPTETFVGTDRFTVKRCNANSQCEQVAIVVEVTEPSSSKGLYGLAALALIPIIGVILFLFRKKLGCASPTESALGDDGKPTGVVSDAANAGAVVSQSLDAENPSATTISSITNPGQQRASQSDPPGSAGSRPTTTNMDIGPHEPRASEITPVNACKKGYLPDNKDQCRSVALSDRNATPLVHAVIMHDDDDNREEEDDDDDKV